MMPEESKQSRKHMSENTMYICVMVYGLYIIEVNLFSEVDSCFQLDSRPITAGLLDMDTAEV